MSERPPIKKPASNKVLLVASYWSGDKTQMQALLKLIADLEPELSEVADLLLVNRFDCEPMEENIVRYLSRKFRVRTHKSERRGTGWPCGCNSLFFGAMEWLFSMVSEKEGIPRYKAAFLIESDCVPLDRNWLRKLVAEWDKHRGGAFIAGVRVVAEHVAEHINGNAFISGDLKFLRWLAVQAQETSVGWDYCMANQFKAWGWGEIPGMTFIWQTSDITEARLEQYRQSGTVWLHGVKNFSALNYARKTLI